MVHFYAIVIHSFLLVHNFGFLCQKQFVCDVSAKREFEKSFVSRLKHCIHRWVNKSD